MGQLETELQELSAAEEFLEYFEIGYDEKVVHVNRLHILQRFHDYLADTKLPTNETEKRAVYKELLTRAYQDFVESDALTEKVFKVFHRHSGQAEVMIPVSSIKR